MEFSINKLMDFRLFFEMTEEEEDLKDLLKKVPKSHAMLANGYKFGFKKHNTLDKKGKYVGSIEPNKKEIIIAAPWEHSRAFVFLHELAHLVYASLTKLQKDEWKKINKNEKNLKDSEEENFCMVYASTYSKHPPVTFQSKKGQQFVKKLK